jgi:NAD(P)-dependent dehydrogenase (short-subunit alcohol dehydrogenase family)
VAGEGDGRDADVTVGLIESRGGRAIADYGDVTDEAAMRNLIDGTVERFGQLDGLVLNAGIVRDRAIWNMSAEDFDKVMNVHVRGTWLPCHFASIHWRARHKAGERVRGRIVTTTSGAGLWGNFGQTNYATAKAAIVGLTLTMSVELHSLGVTVNSVGPGGATRISATRPGAESAIEPDEIPDAEYHPMDPAGSSPLVAWLLSDEAGHVTGQVIRSIHDKLFLMRGWWEAATVSSNERRWDAATIGTVIATDLFGTRAPGLR